LGIVRRLLAWLTTPSSRFALGTLLVAGIAAGVVGWVTFETVMHETSTDEFCSTCHEIEAFAAAEYAGTIHDTNELGLHVNCRDCHIPRAFVPKMMRKVRALNELYQHVRGKLDTPEKYEAHRLEMAMFTWADMNATDSRECRECHNADIWKLEEQSEKAQKYHSGALARGKTCIDCHKGIAHELPAGITEDQLIEGIDF
jgi:cytochrome c-type protein NapC